MKEYIERDAVIEAINNHEVEREIVYSLEEALFRVGQEIRKAIRSVPTAGVVKRVRGEWETLTNCSNAAVYCSVCHKAVVKEQYCRKVKLNFCPNCGADMRKEEV